MIAGEKQCEDKRAEPQGNGAQHRAAADRAAFYRILPCLRPTGHMRLPFPCAFCSLERLMRRAVTRRQESP